MTFFAASVVPASPSRCLTVIRHATACADGPSDHARPLTEQGQREAETLGAWLRAQSEQPTHWICSTAVRAGETFEALHLPPSISMIALDAAYLAGAQELLALLALFPPDCLHGGIIAHNPGLCDLVARGTEHGVASLPLECVLQGFPPAAYARLRADGATWAQWQHADLILESWRDPQGSSGVA